MTLTGLMLLCAGFFGGLMACKYKITDFDSSMGRLRRTYQWLGSKLSGGKKPNEGKTEETPEEEEPKNDGK